MSDTSPLPILPLVLTAASAGVLSAGGLLAYSIFSPRCQFWAPVVRGLTQVNAVALTFDDGPHPDFTPRILDILAQHGIQATFFVIGRFAREYPHLIRRIRDEGHTIGNHSLDHDHFGINRNRAYWNRQIHETQRIVADIIGQPPLLFRPPMGFKNWHVAAAAREARLPIVGWSIRAYDTQPISPEILAARLLRRTTGHDILLLHDGIDPERAAKLGPSATQQHTVDALPAILDGIRRKELQITSLIGALIAGAEARKIATERVRTRAAT
jgi:peptidoglycan/xylan/chitin deacetylase (PgdA/CDA1 family)